ncbi:ribosome maturation factor RimP [Azohydromonas australica]|uniref:ribosome maturation factor RimP n=1 Tax=Azohydromonas australica TaxID=364039 RepID=UPI00048E8405|nr:ribosome maturation factor RimP [Azohydromonas australica]
MNWQAALERTVTGLGYELVEVERAARGLLRVTIDRVPGQVYPGPESESVTVDDCEAVTRQLQYVLEVENADYARLEVSSPGLDRPLKREADYARFAGELVEITLKLPFQGRRKYRGVLQPRPAPQPVAGEGGVAEEPVAAASGGWRLVLQDETPAAARKGGSKAGRSNAKARTKPVDEEAPVQVLDFAFDEVREARLVPVVDFKGRRAQAAQPQEPQQDGGRTE